MQDAVLSQDAEALAPDTTSGPHLQFAEQGLLKVQHLNLLRCKKLRLQNFTVSSMPFSAADMPFIIAACCGRLLPTEYDLAQEMSHQATDGVIVTCSLSNLPHALY